MKKIALLTAAMLFAGAAAADTVNITIDSSLQTPAQKKSATISYAFTPSTPIVFKVAGKTCTWNSSSNPWNAGAGKGCNYSISVSEDGVLYGARSNENRCSDPAAMLRQCINN